MKRILINLHILLLAAFLIQCADKDTMQKHEVKQGDFQASIIESGELEAMHSKLIAMPFLGWKYGWQFKVIYLKGHGDKVSKGDKIIQIDPSPVKSVLEKEKNELEIAKANYNKILVTQNNQISQIKSEMESEKANYELIKLQVDKFHFEPENKQRTKKLELEIASIKQKQINKKLELTREVFRNEIKIQKIKIQQSTKSISEAVEAMNKLEIVSPDEGIFQLERNRRTRKMMELGDEIHQGAVMASIPDMRKMKVSSAVNETDISKIRLKQKVIIRLDAYPDKPFYGEIDNIVKISHEKTQNNPIKVFDIEISVLESDPALKPGMTVSCEIITDNLQNVLYVENECVIKIDSHYFVYLKDSGTEPVPVQLIARNNSFSAISGNIEKGVKLFTLEEIEKEQNNDQ